MGMRSKGTSRLEQPTGITMLPQHPEHMLGPLESTVALCVLGFVHSDLGFVRRGMVHLLWGITSNEHMRESSLWITSTVYKRNNMVFTPETLVHKIIQGSCSS